MTDPIDDTQPLPIADPDLATGPGGDGDAAPASVPGPTAGPSPGPAPASGPTPPGAAGSGPSLRVDPDRPADSGWREPAWFPPRDRTQDRERRSGAVAIAIGLILIAIGAYAFLDRTLGIALPSIQWSSVWPIILIVLGGLILLRALQRKA